MVLKQSNVHKKYLSRIIGVLGALLIFYMICNTLNYIYVEEDSWGRILWHNFYEDDRKIDNIYLGSSHVYQDINPTLLDKINGQYNFNLANGGQLLNGSYYLLKEANKNNTLSHVYLELYYWCNVKDNFNLDRDMIEKDEYYVTNWRNADYMKTSYNKLEYMMFITGTEKYVDTFFPFSRNRINLDNWDYTRQRIGTKAADEYLNYEYYFDFEDGNGYREFKEQGYYYCTRKFLDEQRLIRQDRILGENPMGGKSEEYLRKIISYCQKRDIPITLFVSPMNELKLISTEYYDNYVNQVREIAGEYGVEFYDFNLTKEEYLDIQNGKYFVDDQHLNCKGADMFTTFFSEVVSSTESENEKYFYASYKEKLQSTDPAIYGLYYRDFDGFRTYHVASNGKNGMEYRITLEPVLGESAGGGDTKQLVIQDYSENKEFTLSTDEHGKCTIEARMVDEADAVEVLTINY